MSPYSVFLLVAVIAIVVFHLVRGTLDETVGRFSRQWLPFFVFLFLCVTVAGYALNSFGVPSLFRDDPQLYELHGWPAIRNSSVVWSGCFVTLLLFVIWGFVYHVEGLAPPHGATPAAARPSARRFILVNGMPMSLFLLGAAALPRRAGFAGADLAKAVAGVAIAVGILWVVTWAGRFLLSRLERRGQIAGRRLPARFLDVLSHLMVGPHAGAAVSTASAVSGLGARMARARTAIASPPAATDARRVAVGGAAVFMLTSFVTLTVVTVYPVLQSSVSIVLLLAWVLMVYFVVALFRPWLRLWVVAGMVVYVMWVNAGPFQHTFPTLEAYYDRDDKVRLAPGDRDHVRKSPEGLLQPIETLESWRAGPGAHCSHLVIVATSGGAYRAAYWTGAVLDEIERLSAEPGELAGLRDCIRVITGASGGMVGAAYYAVMRDETAAGGEVGSVIERLNDDTFRSRAQGRHFPTVLPYPRDSLTPVAQQLAQRDVFHVLSPRRIAVDRGLVLEEQWPTLDLPFARLREGERQGRTPSLLVSPMVFSTAGKSFAEPLLISNLNVDSLGGRDWRHAVPFFALFPEVRDSFLVRTAVRMNATFPYVSPAVSLPTAPPARVVDAGYYENYGLAMAASWLFSARDEQGGESAIDWLANRGVGTLLIQVRAFPFDSPAPREGAAAGSGGGFAFLTTPLEAVLAVRESGMNIRNDQQFEMIKALQGDARVRAVSLENTTDVGMSWYLTPHEVDSLRQEVLSKYNVAQWEELGRILRQ